MLHNTHRALALLLLLVCTSAPAANCQQQQQPQSAPPQYRTVNNTVVLSVTEHSLAPNALLVDLSSLSPRAAPPSGPQQQQQQQQQAPPSGSAGAVWEYILKSVRPEGARDALALHHATLRLSSAPTATLDRERLCPRAAAGSGHHVQTERSERSPSSRCVSIGSHPEARHSPSLIKITEPVTVQ